MVAEILRYIDASLWTDLQSGKIKIRLIRAGSTSTVYNNDDFTEIENFTRGSWEDTKNELRITFPDHTKVDFEESTFTWFDPANFQIQGRAPEEITFRGCPSARLASRLASREGRVLTTPLARVTARIDRKAWLVEPGGLFKFTWNEQGITDLVKRVANIKLGTLIDGKITISAIQDVFAVGTETYGNPATTIWSDPLGGEAQDAKSTVGEIPYFLQRDSFNRIFGMAERPSAAHLAYDGALDGEVEILEVDFTPDGLLVADLPQVSNGDYDTVGFDVDTLTDASFVEPGTPTEIGNAELGIALIGNPGSDHEWVAFENVSGSTTLTLDNIWRGILDTPPRGWPADTPVWFFSTGSALFVNVLGNSQTVSFEALTRTMRDQLTTAEATNHN